jgi:signal transduction histidine kinase
MTPADRSASTSARRAPSLSLRLALASVISVAALAVVCVVGLFSLRNISTVTRGAVTRQMALLDESRTFALLLYQKGFVAHYLLTRDPRLLTEIENRRATFEEWLDSAARQPSTEQRRAILDRIRERYTSYDEARRRALALFDAGDSRRAVAVLGETQTHIERLLSLIEELSALRRRQSEQTLAAAETSTFRVATLLVAISVLGALASVAAGFLWARRFARPIYELRLRAESAAHRARIQVDPGQDDLQGLAEHVAALLRRLEDMDGALLEQRRRLAQNEKLSEIGELAAKLAHELLNPLAGMKAAIQLLARCVDAHQIPIHQITETAAALDTEITRVDRLVRRLIDYAKPLSPQFEVCQPGKLLECAVDAARGELSRSGAELRGHLEPDLPPIEVDPLLVSQALSNLICNASQAGPARSTIDVAVRRAVEHGADQVVFEVADHGPGVPAEDLPRLFRPFFTTKPTGNGLGLAVSQHIIVEHGGRITARNREGRGAVFQVSIPVVR